MFENWQCKLCTPIEISCLCKIFLDMIEMIFLHHVLYLFFITTLTNNFLFIQMHIKKGHQTYKDLFSPVSWCVNDS
jgi:hypothetical protein